MSIPQLYNLFAVRHRRTFIVVFLAAFAAATAVTLTLDKEYKAEATLFVGENRPLSTGATSVQLDEVLTRTYAALLKTADVERGVEKAVPFKFDRGSLADKVSFDVEPGTRLIRISALDPDATHAQQLANAYATSFVARQRESAVEASRDQLAQLSQRIGQLSAERAQLAAVTTPAGIEQRARVGAELNAARATYAATQQNSALQGTNVSVASHATVPGTPAKPRTKLYLAVGLLFSFLLAVVAVLLRDVFDDSVRDEEDLRAVLRAPVLTRVPMQRNAGGRPSPARREAFDVLRTMLELDRDRRGPRIISITGAQQGAGKTETVAALAIAYAGAGSRVVAVDADLRRPSLGRRLGAMDPRGLTTVLVERDRRVGDLVIPPPHPGVSVLPTGPLPPNPAVLLGMARLARVLEELRATHDVVLVDTPPTEAGADSTAVAAISDGVLVVVDMRTARRRLLVRLREELDRTATPVLGVVLNREHESPAYDYGPDPSLSSRPTASV